MSDAASVDLAASAPAPRKRARVVVVGSANTDMVARVARLPKPGETVLGGDFASAAGRQRRKPGRRGSAARRGRDLYRLCRRGQARRQLVLGLEAEGIDTRHVVRDPDAPTGVALITVDEATGENVIVVALGRQR